jgi:hypothetical protein
LPGNDNKRGNCHGRAKDPAIHAGRATALRREAKAVAEKARLQESRLLSVGITLTIITVALFPRTGAEPIPLIQALGAFLTLAPGYIFGKAGS